MLWNATLLIRTIGVPSANDTHCGNPRALMVGRFQDMLGAILGTFPGRGLNQDLLERLVKVSFLVV